MITKDTGRGDAPPPHPPHTMMMTSLDFRTVVTCTGSDDELFAEVIESTESVGCSSPAWDAMGLALLPSGESVAVEMIVSLKCTDWRSSLTRRCELSAVRERSGEERDTVCKSP